MLLLSKIFRHWLTDHRMACSRFHCRSHDVSFTPEFRMLLSGLKQLIFINKITYSQNYTQDIKNKLRSSK